MSISTDIEYASLEELYLDPMNPRLGRHNAGPNLTQEKVLELMRDWTLDELVVSFIESGVFWTHEALLVTEEKLYGKNRLVVVEGNRRLAALKYMKMAIDHDDVPRRIAEIVKGAKIPPNLFTKIPYILVSSRKEIEAFLGFRHVTGIKEWEPAEKAQFIAKLIDERGMTYEEVRRQIGSKGPSVRNNYISYRLLLQIEDNTEIPPEQFEDRFSVMYLSLRTKGVQKYLDINIEADPKTAKKPVPTKRLKELANFALWLFGDGDKRPPLFSDSREVENFGKILDSGEAIDYLKRTPDPVFGVALRMAGGDEPEIANYIEKAADNLELALTRVHLFKRSSEIQKATKRVGAHALQLLKVFPDIAEELKKAHE
jgi:hypothetical protein